MKVEFRITGDKRLRKVMDKLGERGEEKIKEINLASALGVERTMKKSIQGGPAGGRTYEKYNPRRTHTASGPGQPPMTDTGALVNSIQHKTDGMDVIVFSRLKYALFLEFGTQKMAARPYFRPAMERERPKYIERYDKLVSDITQGLRT